MAVVKCTRLRSHLSAKNFYSCFIQLLFATMEWLAGVGCIRARQKQTRQEHQGGRWGRGSGQEKARKHRHSLSSISDKQTEDHLGWPDAPTQTWIWQQTHRRNRVRIACNKTTRHLQSVSPRASRAHSQQAAGQTQHDTCSQSVQGPVGHTVNKQPDKHNTQRLEMGMRGRRGGGKMEQYLVVNGRRLFVTTRRG